MAVFVPEFEVERVARRDRRSNGSSPTRSTRAPSTRCAILGRVLADMGITGALGADRTAIPGILGYEGPALSEVDGQPGRAARAVHREHDGAQERGRGGADPRERPLVRARAPAPAGVLAARERPRPRRACAPATRRRSRCSTTLGPSYGGQQASSDGVSAGYRGQIGRRSSWAHAVAHNIEFREGDVLVTETSAPVWGYNAELERAMIIGAPTDEMRRLFDHTVAAQQVAFDALRPGVTCADVDSAVLGYFEAQRPAAVLAPARRPRDRAAQPRGAVPRRRRSHAGRARHGVHDRAGPLLERDRRLPPLRHGRRHPRRDRHPHVVPAATSRA